MSSREMLDFFKSSLLIKLPQVLTSWT